MKYSRIAKFNIISGIIIIIFSVILLVFSTTAIIFLLIILAITLLFLGITQILNTRSDINLEGTNLKVKYLVGVFEFLVGILLIASLAIDPIGTAVFSIRLIGFLILLVGLAMLYVGSMNYEYRKEYRYILMIVGLLSIFFGVLILIVPTIGFSLVAIIVAFPLLLNGIARLSKGILN